MKKRLVTTAILMLVISLFFCSSVFADTVIQGYSDTVTETYGSNDITIALRARRLAVINTGTAAAGYAGYTPVIVSMTIYNLGNQNCLINNLKFRLTSDSMEHTIAGVENLSQDLMISDTPYDTTGYLSIKASNDYTYAGGFVVPANSNMTFVGIINVTANWISENQTWRVVDLYDAEFYENMTTTVGDYPCDAEPIDLSSIELDIDSIVTTLQGMDLDSSTYLPMLQDILSDIAYTGSSPTNLNEAVQTSNLDVNLATGLRLLAYRWVSSPRYITYDYEYNPTDDTYTAVGTKRYRIYTVINLNNTSEHPYVSYKYNTLKSFFANTLQGRMFYIDYFYSDNYKGILPNGTSAQLYNRIQYGNSTSYSIVPAGNNLTIIQGYIDVHIDTVVTFNPLDASTFNNGKTYQTIDGYYPADEYTILRDLYLSLNPESTSNDPDDVNTESQSINTAVENIQAAEAQYFADNQEAIENTGLSNFHFNDNQIWSLTMIVDQFEAVWNALGEFTVVYIFTLMMSLATYLIRHEPTTKVKQWRESVSAERAERTSYYSRKNAEARAHDSTMKKALRRR